MVRLKDDPLEAYLDLVAVNADLWVRSLERGDRFHPLGMAQEKRLQDFMVDARIPRPRRDEVPLVCCSRGIVWVVGWRIAHWARVTEATQQVLHLRFEPTEETNAVSPQA